MRTPAIYYSILLLAIGWLSTSNLQAQQIQGDTVVCNEFYRYYTFPTVDTLQYEWSVQGGHWVYVTQNADSFAVQWTTNSGGLITLYERDSTYLLNTYTLNIDLTGRPSFMIRPSFLSVCSTPVFKEGEGMDMEIGGGGDCFVVCDNTPISFYPAPYRATSTYEWSLFGITMQGDTFNAHVDTLYWTADSIRVVWNGAGIGLVILKETTENGCSNTRAYCMQVKEKPTATFKVDSINMQSDTVEVCLGGEVKFESTTIINEDIAELSWLINGIVQGAPQGNVFKPVFNTPGVYEVALVVRTNCNCTDTMRVYVKVHPEPEVEIECPGVMCEAAIDTYTVNAVCSDYESAFTVHGSTDYQVIGNQIIINWNDVGASGYGQIIFDGADCGESCPVSTVVNIPVITSQGSIYGETVICSGDANVMYSVPFWPGTWYSWAITDTSGTEDMPVLYQSDQSTVIVQIEDFIGTFTLSVRYENELLECEGEATAEISVREPMELYVQERVCAGDTIQLEVTPNTSTFPYMWQVTELFGVGSHVVHGQTTPTIDTVITQPGVYLFIVSNEEYCNVAARTVQVTDIPPNPLSIQGADSICPGIYYSYTAQTISPDYYIEWEIVDGNNPVRIDQGPNIFHTFTTTGPYSVTAYQLTVDNPDCRSAGIVKQVYQMAPPAFEISGPDTVCANSLSSYASTLTSGSNYSWSLSHPSAGSIFNASSDAIEIQWNNPNTLPLDVQLYLSFEVCGQSLSDTLDIHIMPNPTPEITLTGDTCAGEWTIFTASGVSTGIYNWTFLPQPPEQIQKNDPSVNTQFTQSGSYTALLEIENPDGCTIASTTSLSFTIVPLPVAHISLDSGRAHYCIDTINGIDIYARLVRTSQAMPGYHYQWAKDNVPISGTDNQDVYVVDNSNIGASLDEPGMASYSLMVTDSTTGCSNFSNYITIQWIFCEEDTICNTYTTVNPVATRDCNKVDFSATVTNSQFQYGDIWWNVNYPSSNPDYYYSTNSPFTHEYQQSGIYTIQVGVSSYENDGNTITDSTNICAKDTMLRVVVPLVPDFEYEFKCNANNEMGVLLTSSSNFVAGYTTITQTNWEIIDHTNTTVHNDTMPPTSLPEGDYIITITETFNYSDGTVSITGEQCSKTDTIYVPGVPEVSFTALPTPSCEGTPVHFTATATATSVTAWHWQYGDGSSSLLPESSVRTYEYEEQYDPGYVNPNIPLQGYSEYFTTLTIEDVYGCTATAALPVVVHQDNFHYRIAGDSLACPGTVVNLTTVPNTGPPGNPQGLPEWSTNPVSYNWNTGATTSGIQITQSGIYEVEMFDAHGCRELSSFKVLYTGLPSIVIRGDELVCYDYEDDFELLGPLNIGTANYLWQHATDTINGPWISFGQNDRYWGEPGQTVYDIFDPNETFVWTPGVHYVRLIVTNNPIGGMLCSDTSTTFHFTILDPMPQPEIVSDYACELPTTLRFDNLADFNNPLYFWTNGSVNEEIIDVVFSGQYGLMVIDSFGCMTGNIYTLTTLPIMASMGMECVTVCDTSLIGGKAINSHISAPEWWWLHDNQVVSTGSGQAVLMLDENSPEGWYYLAISGTFNGMSCTDTLQYLCIIIEPCCEDSLWAYIDFVNDTLCNYAIPYIQIGTNQPFFHAGIPALGWSGNVEMAYIMDSIPGVVYNPANNTYTYPLTNWLGGAFVDTILEVYMIPHNGDSLGNAACTADTLWTSVVFERCYGCDSLVMVPQVSKYYEDGMLRIRDESTSAFGYDMVEMWYNGQYYNGAPGSIASFTMENINSCDTLYYQITAFIDDLCCIEADTLYVCLDCDDINAGMQVNTQLDGHEWQMELTMSYQPDYVVWTFPDSSKHTANTHTDNMAMHAEWTDTSGNGGWVCVMASVKFGEITSPCGTTHTKCCNITYCFDLGVNQQKLCEQAGNISTVITDMGSGWYELGLTPDTLILNRPDVSNVQVQWLFDNATGTDNPQLHNYLCSTLTDTLYQDTVVYSFEIQLNPQGATGVCTYILPFEVEVEQCSGQQRAVVYPNPAEKEIHISFAGIDLTHAHYTIYDPLGKVMHQRTKVKSVIECVPTENWAEGTYYIYMEYEKKMQTTQFIKGNK